MQTLNREEAEKMFERFWDEMSQEFFKIEVLQDYTGEDAGPAMDAWMAGDKERARELMREEAKEFVELGKQKSAVSKTRVHVVETPHTPYMEYELAHYRVVNVPLVGEEVYIVPKVRVSDLPIPDGDVLIFDQKRAVKFSYTLAGRMIAADIYDVADGDDISRFLSLREALLARATPVSEAH